MGSKETTHYYSFLGKIRVCCSYKCCVSSSLDAKDVKRYVAEPARINNYLLRQKFKNCTIKELYFPQYNEAHRLKISFHKRINKNKEIFLELWKSEDQLGDKFTKQLARDAFWYLWICLGVTSFTQWIMPCIEQVPALKHFVIFF